MIKVFLSYSRLDRAVVAPIASVLRGLRIDVFRDEESIVPGDAWKATIAEAVSSSDTVLLFWSAAAADSKSVEEEYSLALSLRKRIVPVLLDDTPLTTTLAQYQWADLRKVVQAAMIRSITAAVTGAGAGAVGGVPLLIPMLLGFFAYSLGAAFAGSKALTIHLSEPEQRAVKEALLARLQRPSYCTLP